MKVSKIFGCVLGLHVCIIAVLLMQPGCQNSQPPTQTHTQKSTMMKPSVQGASRSSDEMIPATRVGGLDSAFNAGLNSDTPGLEPIDSYEPIDPITPIDSFDSAPTVDVAGPGYQSYTVKKGDSLWSISKRYSVTLNELYAANGLNKNSVLRIGQQIQIPVEGGTATVNTVTPEVYQPSGYNQATTAYTVVRGDTLSRIANKFDTTVGAIKAANGKTSDVIRVGETLTVPVGASADTSPAASPSPAPTTTLTTSRPSGATQTHTVKSGEYPAKIAKQYGMTTSELLSINNISDPRKLRVGQELIVNGSGSSSNVDSRIETVVTPTRTQTTTVEPTTPVPAIRTVPNDDIIVIEADPLVEGELTGVEEEDAFDNAIEVPVIRLEE